MEYNIYCDESCHLENDKNTYMFLGGIICPKSSAKEINIEIRQLKEKYHARGELKWTKVSKSRETYYLALVDYFFSNEDLNFRSLIVQNKHQLDHKKFNDGNHDNFYYKMYYYLISNWNLFTTENIYNIYLDIKDTRSSEKKDNLNKIICLKKQSQLINRLQHVKSHEIEILQLADFFIGALAYNCRDLSENKTKIKIIDRIKMLSDSNIKYTTAPWEEKFNLFYFNPRKSEQ